MALNCLNFHQSPKACTASFGLGPTWTQACYVPEALDSCIVLSLCSGLHKVPDSTGAPFERRLRSPKHPTHQQRFPRLLRSAILSISETVSRNGNNQVIIGDLNARHTNWDTLKNVRGTEVMKMVIRTPEERVVGENEPYYFKKIKITKGGHINPQRNLEIAIVNTHDASAYIKTSDWRGVSDHRPVTYIIKYRLKLNEAIQCISKPLFL